MAITAQTANQDNILVILAYSPSVTLALSNFSTFLPFSKEASLRKPASSCPRKPLFTTVSAAPSPHQMCLCLCLLWITHVHGTIKYGFCFQSGFFSLVQVCPRFIQKKIKESIPKVVTQECRGEKVIPCLTLCRVMAAPSSQMTDG